jgi:hypothetical protein
MSHSFSLRYKVDILTFQKGGAALLRYYEDSHVNALQSLYPELKLSERRFLESEEFLKGFNRPFVFGIININTDRATKQGKKIFF